MGRVTYLAITWPQNDIRWSLFAQFEIKLCGQKYVCSASIVPTINWMSALGQPCMQQWPSPNHQLISPHLGSTTQSPFHPNGPYLSHTWCHRVGRHGLTKAASWPKWRDLVGLIQPTDLRFCTLSATCLKVPKEGYVVPGCCQTHRDTDQTFQKVENVLKWMVHVQMSLSVCLELLFSQAKI